MTAYPTFDRAAARVDMLRRAGTWPGITLRPDGTCVLTYDPGEPEGDGEHG